MSIRNNASCIVMLAIYHELGGRGCQGAGQADQGQLIGY
jgi:hypothetical protein